MYLTVSVFVIAKIDNRLLEHLVLGYFITINISISCVVFFPPSDRNVMSADSHYNCEVPLNFLDGIQLFKILPADNLSNYVRHNSI